MKQLQNGEHSRNGLHERFDAAVRVIRTLPANGSFQPSREMLLRFYALFKQATEGPCTNPKPAFYDVTNRAKWEAYKTVEYMSQEVAMEEYVAELKKIIEMMSLTPEVSEFLDKLGSFYELVNDEDKSKPPQNIPQTTAFNGNHSDAVKTALNVIARSQSSVSPQNGSQLSIMPNLPSTSNGQTSHSDHESAEDYEDDEEDDINRQIDLEIQQEIIGGEGSSRMRERRDSVDSFKSLATETESHLENGRSSRSLLLEMEAMKQRMNAMEELSRIQAERLKTLETLVRKNNEEAKLQHHSHFETQQTVGGSSIRVEIPNQVRLMELVHRYWILLESRIKRIPIVSGFVVIVLPIFVQLVSYFFRRIFHRKRP